MNWTLYRCDWCGAIDVNQFGPDHDSPEKPYPTCFGESEPVEVVAVDRLGFNGLMRIAQKLLEEHYPADLMVAMADDPGPRLTLALRECMAVMEKGHR